MEEQVVAAKTTGLMKQVYAVFINLLSVPVFTYSQDNIEISNPVGMTLPKASFGDFYQPVYGGTGFLFRVSDNFLFDPGEKFYSISDGETNEFCCFISGLRIAFK